MITHWAQIAVAVSLVVYIGAFVVIVVTVRCRAGASPRGHARGHLPAALFNGLATLLLLVTAIAYSLYTQSLDWFGRIAFFGHPLAQAVGLVSLSLGALCLVWGEVSLVRSFRVALAESVQPLVTRGIYCFTRNPLALSVDLLALGVLLLAPSWLALISLMTNVATCALRTQGAQRSMPKRCDTGGSKRSSRQTQKLSDWRQIHDRHYRRCGECRIHTEHR